VAPVTWLAGGAAEEKDIKALRKILENIGTDATAIFTDIALLPDGDRFLFAGMPFDEQGNTLQAELNGGYTVILRMRPDGRQETVFAAYQDTGGDVTGLYNLKPVGIYDLNDDGRYEICAWMKGWEGGYYCAFSQGEDGSWGLVLTGIYGT
jgi:hypothetical protein